MKKRLAVLGACVAMSVFLAGCSSGSNDVQSQEEAKASNGEVTQPTGSFETVNAQGSKQYSFEEANVLSFELNNRDDTQSNTVEAMFSITSNAVYDVNRVSVKFAYTDEAGNVIYDDGRTSEFGVPAGKSSYITSYAQVDEAFSKSDISNVEVVSYGYQAGDTIFEVDLKNGKSNNWKTNSQECVDFDSANVVSFEYDDKGKTSNESYEVGVRALNEGDRQVSDIIIRVAYFDSEGNYLGSGDCMSENTIDPGNFANIKSFFVDSGLSNSVASFGVYSYNYKLIEDDENGFNYYEVNLKTNEAIGRHID